jgi:hypothetical protein
MCVAVIYSLLCLFVACLFTLIYDNGYYVEFLFNIVIYIFSLCLCILIVCFCIFIVPAGTLRLPRLSFFRAFSTVVRQIPRYNPQRRGTARTLPKYLRCSIYCLFCFVMCIVCVEMCAVLLLPHDSFLGGGGGGRSSDLDVGAWPYKRTDMTST